MSLRIQFQEFMSENYNHGVQTFYNYFNKSSNSIFLYISYYRYNIYIYLMVILLSHLYTDLITIIVMSHRTYLYAYNGFFNRTFNA